MRIHRVPIMLAAYVLVASGCGIFVKFDGYEDEPVVGQGGGGGDASIDTAVGGKSGNGGSGGHAGASGKGGSAGKSGGSGSSGTAGSAGAGGSSGAGGSAGGGGVGGASGSSGSGGSAATSGTGGAGGSAGIGGASGTGGTAGTGGAAGTGGTAGVGGAAGTGGTSGTAGAAGTGGTVGTCAAGRHCEVALDPLTWTDTGNVLKPLQPCTKASVQIWDAAVLGAINAGISTCSWDCTPHESFCTEALLCSTAADCTYGASTVWVYSHQCTTFGNQATQFCRSSAVYPPTCDLSDVTPDPPLPEARKTCTVASSACNGSPGACVDDTANCLLSNNPGAPCPAGYNNPYVFYQSVDDQRCKSGPTCAAATCMPDASTTGQPQSYTDNHCQNSLSHAVTTACQVVGTLGSLWLPNAPQCATGLSAPANASIDGSQSKRVCCKAPLL